MHFVLCRFERDAGDHACRLDSFCGTRFAVAGDEPVFEDAVERMLHASEAFGGVIILVVNVDIIVFHRLLHFGREEIVVDKGFCCLAGELHHHPGRGVGVHVGVLAGYVVVFRLDDLKKHVAGLCAAGNAALVAIGYITFGDILSRGLHELDFHAVLDGLHGHAFVAAHADAVGYFGYQSLVFSHFGGEHGLADRRFYLLFVISDYAAVALFD